VFAQDEGGNTPLHIAALWSHMKLLEFLWQEGGAKLAEIKNSEGLTANELAYEENQIYAHEFLSEKMGIKTSFMCNIL
jgi:ankyrin repeat protein